MPKVMVAATSFWTGWLSVLAILFVVLGIPGTITWLKGHRALFFAAILGGGLVWWITALRLARPDSWWANRFYGSEKHQRAVARYGYA